MEISHLWELICVGEVEECLEDRLAHILDVHVPLLPFSHWGIQQCPAGSDRAESDRADAKGHPRCQHPTAGNTLTCKLLLQHASDE